MTPAPAVTGVYSIVVVFPDPVGHGSDPTHDIARPHGSQLLRPALPIWIFDNLFRPNQAPLVNVIAVALVVLLIVPVWLAQRIGGEDAGTSRM